MKKWYDVRMKAYLVKSVVGFHVGHFTEPTWTDKQPTCTATVCIEMLGIDRETLVDYWKYLWRLGEYTWGARYVTVGGPARKALDLERFAEYFVLKLWPSRGRRWRAVGASGNAWGWRSVMWQKRQLGLPWVYRVIEPYDIILRYRERLWWARSVFMAHENKWVFEGAVEITYPLMFESRGTEGAKKNEDEWNFGMSWWEAVGERFDYDMYLWHSAEVRYLGMAIRKGATVFDLQGK